MAYRPDIIAGRAVIIVTIQDTIDKELRRLRTTFRRFANSIATVGSDAFRFGIAGTIGGILPIKEFVDFEDRLLFLQTKIEGTTEEFIKLEQVIRQLGKTTSFTPQEVAEAGIKFGEAGFSAIETINSLQAALDLSRGGRVDLDTATTILTNSLRTFGLSAEYAGIAASKFITASRLGTLDIIDLNESLKYSSGTFRTLNIDMDNALALITQLSNVGARGTTAGTSLNTAFQNIAANADKLEKSLGLVFTDEQLTQPVKVLRAIDNELQKLGRQEGLRILQDVFNIRGSRAVSGSIIGDLDKLEETLKTIQNSFVEARDAAILLDSRLGGAFRRARGAVEEFAIVLGETISGPLNQFFKSIQTLFDRLGKIAKTNPALVQFLVALPPLLLIGGSALLVFSSALASLATILSPLISLNAVFFDLLYKTVVLLGKKIILVAIFIELARRLKVVQDFFKKILLLGKNVKEVFYSLSPALASVTDGLNDLFAGNIELGLKRIKVGLKDLENILRTGLFAAWQDFLKSIDDVVDNLKIVYAGIKNVASAVGNVVGSVYASLASLAPRDAVAPDVSQGLALLFGLLTDAVYEIGRFILINIDITKKLYDLIRSALLSILRALSSLPGIGPQIQKALDAIQSPKESAQQQIDAAKEDRLLLQGDSIIDKILPNFPFDRSKILERKDRELAEKIRVGEDLIAKMNAAETGPNLFERLRQLDVQQAKARSAFQGVLKGLDSTTKGYREAADAAIIAADKNQLLINSQKAVQAQLDLLLQKLDLDLSLLLNRFGLTRNPEDPAAQQIGNVLGQLYLRMLGQSRIAQQAGGAAEIVAGLLGTALATRGALFQPNPALDEQIQLLSDIEFNTRKMAQEGLEGAF